MSLCWHDYGDGEHATQYPAGFVIQRRRPRLWALFETVPRGRGSECWQENLNHGEHVTLWAAKASCGCDCAGQGSGVG